MDVIFCVSETPGVYVQDRSVLACTLYVYSVIISVIVTHVMPLKPLLQLQRKALPMALHTPLLWHGLGMHAVISVSQRPPVYWGPQLQAKPDIEKRGKEREIQERKKYIYI